jgi:hypothetical protein
MMRTESRLGLRLALACIAAAIGPWSAADATWIARYDGGAQGRDAWLGIATADRNCVVPFGTSSGTSGFDIAVARYAANGTRQWLLRWDGSEHMDDLAHGGCVAPTGTLFVTGATGADSQTGGGSSDCVTVAISPTGTLLWARTYAGAGAGPDFGERVAAGPTGIAYVAGTLYDSATHFDWLVLAYAVDGTALWNRTYDGPLHTSDFAVDLVARPAGGIVVAGIVGDSLGYGDIGVRAYDAAGNLSWNFQYGGPAGLVDRPTDLAVDAQGNTYVAGYSGGNGTQGDWLTLKVSAAGALLWNRRMDGGHGWDGAAAVAVDASSNAYVAGSVATSDSTFDYRVCKYSPEGDLRWSTNFAGGGLGVNGPTSVALGPLGNVYVTGGARTATNERDIVTLRLDPGSGGITGIWDTGSGLGEVNAGAAVASDSTEGVYVAGVSTDVSGNSDAAVLHLDRGGLTDVSPVDQPAARLAFSLRTPSPIQGGAIAFRIELPQAGRLDARLIDVAGRVRKRILPDQNVPAGVHDIRVPSSEVAAGVYILVIRGQSGTTPIAWTRKLVIVH